MSSAHDTERMMAAYGGRRVVVTGGMGFIGSNLALRLDSLGADILVLDAMVPEHGGNPENLVGASSRVAVRRLDLRDGDSLDDLLADTEIVFNLAGQVSHIDSMQRPLTDLALNTVAQVEFLEACRRRCPTATIVYASTRQIYGRPDYLPVDEAHPLRPVDVNGINKLASEAYHTLYADIYGLRAVSLRLTNVYGPRLRIRDARQTFVGLWLRRALEDGVIEVWGGQQMRDLTFVDDVVDAFLLAALTPSLVGQALNVGGSESVSLAELARRLVEAAGGGRIEFRTFPPERLRIDIGDYRADDRAFRAASGWHPRIGLDEGLRRSLDWFRPRLAAYV